MLQLKDREAANGAVIVEVKGEVDMETSPGLQKQLIGHFRRNCRMVIVDLSNVSYIDSSGIATFVEGWQWSHTTNNKFRLVGLAPAVRDILDIARLTAVFEIFESSEDALKGL